MRLRHRARTAVALACSAGALAVPSLPARAADRVLPHAGVLYIGTATEDAAGAGAVSVRIGLDGASLVSLLGGHFHGDLCATDTAMFAGPGGIDPVGVNLGTDGKFSGTQVSAAPDGARVASTLRGRFSADAATASATLTYALTPVSGARACTVTATLALHKAPATPGGKLTPPRTGGTYHAVTHQGWPATLITKPKAANVLSLGAWDVCHYRADTTVHFLYPEHVSTQLTIAHGRFSAHVAATGGSGHLEATVTGQFVGPHHHLSGALHVRRTGTIDGNDFVCDSQRVLFSAP
ncbi:MAG: hypothetical protein QOJ11_3299 [Frankiales bacterium]|jgi:hypothetical protein|nr:hypothetical protein [Frankiales bacterium]